MIEERLRDLVREVVREEVRAALDEQRPEEAEPAPDREPRYLTAREAARIASVRPETVRGWVARGELPDHRAGRLLRVRLDQLQAYLARARRPRGGMDEDERVRHILDRVG